MNTVLVAVHELGHWLAQIACGWPIDLVTIVPSASAAGCVFPTYPPPAHVTRLDHLVILEAGDVAQRLLTPAMAALADSARATDATVTALASLPPADRQFISEVMAYRAHDADEEKAAKLAAGDTDLLRQARIRAWEVVDVGWPQLLIAVPVLLARRTLTGAQLEAALRGQAGGLDHA